MAARAKIVERTAMVLFSCSLFSLSRQEKMSMQVWGMTGMEGMKGVEGMEIEEGEKGGGGVDDR